MLALPAQRIFLRQRLILMLLAAGCLVAGWTLSPKLALALLIGTAGLILTLRYPVMGFALLGFSVPWSEVLPLTGGGTPVTPTDLLVAAVGLAWLVACVERRSFGFREAPWIPYVGLFLAAIVLSTTQASDVAASVREIVKWTELAVVYLAGTTFLRTKQDVRIVAGAIVLAGVSQAALGYVQSALALGPASFGTRLFLLRAYGSFDQPNPYAGYLNLTLSLAVAFALTLKRGPERRLYGVAAVLIGAAVVASQSRGALLAGLLAVGVMLAYTSRPMFRLFWLGMLAIAISALAISYGVFPSSISDKVLNAVGLANVSFNSVTNANFSAVERAAHWLAGVRMFAAHPLLGVGIGNYAAAYPHYHPRGWYASLDHAHNYYINIAAEAGIVGLATYLLALASALWYSCVSARLASDGVLRAAALGVTGALIATSFHNLFDVLYVHGIVPLIGLLLALASVGFYHGRGAPALALGEDLAE